MRNFLEFIKIYLISLGLTVLVLKILELFLFYFY